MPFPSPREVFTKYGLTQMHFTSGTVAEKSDGFCPICQEDYFEQSRIDREAIALTNDCRHWFHTTCLLQWVAVSHLENGKATCPLCRARFYPSMCGLGDEAHLFIFLEDVVRRAGTFTSSFQADPLLRELHCILKDTKATNEELQDWVLQTEAFRIVANHEMVGRGDKLSITLSVLNEVEAILLDILEVRRVEVEIEHFIGTMLSV